MLLRLINRLNMPLNRLTQTLVCILVLAAGHVNAAQGQAPDVAASWSTPSAGLQSVAFDAGGQHLALVYRGGRIDCRSVSGAQQWSATIADATSAVLAPGASFLLAYSEFDPTRTSVTIVDVRGKALWKRNVAGAVWCADACLTADGVRFVVGTGERYVYVFDVGAHRRRYRRWRVPGVVVSVSIDPDGQRVCYGTWQRSTIGCATARGRNVWESKAESSSLQYLDRLQAPNTLLLRSMPNNPILDGEFALLSAKGRVRWSGKLDSSRSARVVVSPNGSFACVGYTKAISHKEEAEREQHAVLYDRSGKRIWDKGSLFFRAYPLLVTSSGYVLVQGTENELFWIGHSGEPDPSIKLGTRVRTTWMSRDGSRVLFLCSDGKLHMLAITQ